MMNSKKILFFISFCYATGVSIAQEIKNESVGEKYRAVHWGLEEGLSQGITTGMLKDINGFLWIGTENGLNRFDGSLFKKYFAEKAKKNKTIIGNKIRGLIEDSLHNIWIGTDKGLSWYDIKADTFRNVTAGLPLRTFVPFWATREDLFFLVLADKGLEIAACNIHSFAKKDRVKFTLAQSDSLANVYPWANTIYDAGSNSIWMAKGALKQPGGGLLQVSLTNGKIETFPWACFRGILNHCHFSQAMRYDQKRNSIWINSPDGLLEFTLSDKKFHQVDLSDEWLKLIDFGSGGIDIDPGGRIWVGTQSKGIFIYDPLTRSVNMPFPDDSALEVKVAAANVSIYCDREGMIWSGSWLSLGIYQLIHFSQVVTRYTAGANKPHWLSSDFVRNCINADQGRIWMSTPGGINIFDPHTNLFEMLPLKDKSFNTGDLFAAKVDTISKKAWILDFGIHSLFGVDLYTGICRKVIFKDSNNRDIPIFNWLWAIPYRNGCMIQGSYDNHLAFFELNSDNTVARQVLSLPGESSDEYYTGGDNDHLLFLRRPDSASNLTYTSLDGKWIRNPNPLDSIQWRRVFYNKSDKTYWLTNVTQLLHYSKDFRLIGSYGEKDGLPGLEIYGLIADNRNNIWFSTDRSLHELNTSTGTIITLSKTDGFEPKNIQPWASPVIDDGGDLYFPGGGWDGMGFDRVNPDKLVSVPSFAYLESLEINQVPFALPTGVNNLQDLSLRHFENNITIKTGNIDYYSKGSGKIRYKLELDGKNAGWQYAPEHGTIIYTGLQPGKYKLVIQASNAANEFSGPEKILFVTISPAFWNEWWFRIIAAIFILSIFYLLIRYRTQQRFRLQLERTGKEKQIAELGLKTAELGEKAAVLQQQKIEMEMQALRAQMNPHFIFNSLNSINRFILQNNRNQASEYLTKFSKLVRMILQNSQASLISLESELESLDLYINLEAVRFDHHFEYKISVPKNLDVELLKVPPLFIQPYVENAIWHGLMHKEEKGYLDIEVSQEDTYLYFKITDNGIGRKKAAEIAGKSATKHKSMGLKITAHRIAMMQRSNGEESPVKINDLTEPDGTAAGTEVVIKMPVIEEV